MTSTGPEPAEGEFRPIWTMHPGEALRELLEERGIPQTYLAFHTGFSAKHVNQVIQGKASISAHFALGLEDALINPPAEFWARHQAIYDVRLARIARDIEEAP